MTELVLEARYSILGEEPEAPESVHFLGLIPGNLPFPNQALRQYLAIFSLQLLKHFFIYGGAE